MASRTTILLLLAASQLLAAQAYDAWYPSPDQQQVRRQAAPGGHQQAFNAYGTPQIGLRFGSGSGQSTQNLVDDQLEVVDMRAKPTAATVRPQAAATLPSGSLPSGTLPQVPTSYMDRFSSKLFQPIASANLGRNLAYSPVSVHALMCLIYGVSQGKTLLEVKEAGVFGGQLESAGDFKDLIDYRKDLGDVEQIMAIRVYYNRHLGGVNRSFPPFATSNFRAGIQAVDMENGVETAGIINAWVSDSTRGKISNLVSSADLDPRTQGLLVSAIYFKGRWEREFATMDTLPFQFRHSDGTSSSVAMMYNDDTYGLADLPELGATALELAYKGSATSMLILLPKQPNGLANLERQLAGREFDLNKIAARIRRQPVTVRLPKFRVEFEQDMTGPLQVLGVRQMFTPQSQINIMLDQPVRVEKILQKAFIEVGEAGTEAAAASFAKFVPLSLPLKSQEFTADHPFVFAIRTPSSVLFMGHVEHPTPMAEGTDALSMARKRMRG